MVRDGTVMTRNLQWEAVFVVVDPGNAGIYDRDMSGNCEAEDVSLVEEGGKVESEEVSVAIACSSTSRTALPSSVRSIKDVTEDV
jgi:hypothetical protein